MLCSRDWCTAHFSFTKDDSATEPAAHQVQVVARAAFAVSLQQRVEAHQILLALWQAVQCMPAMVQQRQEATRRAARSEAQHSTRRLPRIPAALPPCPAIQTRLGSSQRCQGAARGNCELLNNLTMPLAWCDGGLPSLEALLTASTSANMPITTLVACSCLLPIVMMAAIPGSRTAISAQDSRVRGVAGVDLTLQH